MPPKSPSFYKKKVKMGGFFRAVTSPHTPFLERTALIKSQFFEPCVSSWHISELFNLIQIQWILDGKYYEKYCRIFVWCLWPKFRDKRGAGALVITLKTLRKLCGKLFSDIILGLDVQYFIVPSTNLKKRSPTLYYTYDHIFKYTKTLWNIKGIFNFLVSIPSEKENSLF